MELTIGVLKQIIADLPDDTVLATLGTGNDEFDAFISLKRLLLLEGPNGKRYLTINEMGSHFTGQGHQKGYTWLFKYWDENTLKTNQP